MIIVYSINEKILNSKKLFIAQSNEGSGKSNVELTVHQQYLSLFGPMGPLGFQRVEAFDLDRNEAIPPKKWSDEIKQEAQNLKAETPYAWGLFRNTFIIAGVFLALFLIMPIVNQNRAKNQAADLTLMKEKFKTTAPEDILRVSLLGNADGGGERGITLMKIVRMNGDSLVVKRHEKVLPGFTADVADALDAKDSSFQNKEEKFQLKHYNTYEVHKILLPFPDESQSSPSAIGTVLDIDKKS